MPSFSIVTYTGDGVTPNRTFPFPYLDRADIAVFVNDVPVAFTFLNSAAVSITTTPASGAFIQIKRLTQKGVTPVNFTDGSVLLEKDLDLLATYNLYIAQEASDLADVTLRPDFTGNMSARGLRLINLAPGINPSDAVTRSQFLALAETIASPAVSATNAAAAALASANASAGSAAASAGSATDSANSAALGLTYSNNAAVAVSNAAANNAAPTGSGLIGFTALGVGATGRTVQEKLRESLSVFDFMTAAEVTAIRDRTLTFDASAAMGAALTEAKLRGVSLLCPAGSYKISNVLVEDVAIVGTGVQANDSPVNDGTVFCIYDTINPAFRFNRGARFEGFSMYWPTQVLTGTPTVFPAAFKSNTVDTVTQVAWDNLNVINAYSVFEIGDAAYTQGHGRMSLTNSTIYGIAKVFDMHQVLDVIQVNNCIFTWGTWDAVSGNTQTIKNWSAKNATFAVMDRVDGFSMSNSIVYGTCVGIRAIKGMVDLSTFSNVHFDAVPVPLKVSTTSAFSNATFASCSFNCYTFGDAATAPDSMEILSDNVAATKVTFSACQFAVARGNFFVVGGTSVTLLTLSACHFHAIGTATGAAGDKSHVYTNNTNAVVNISGCNFDSNGYVSSASVLLNSVRDFIITGSRWRLSTTPITVATMSGLGTITGNVSSGTSGVSSVVLQTVAAKKGTLLGLNAWDKINQDNVGSPKFNRQLGAATSVSVTEQRITFGTAIFDTTSSYSNSDSVYFVPMTGVYRFSTRLTHDSTASGSRWLIKFNSNKGSFSSYFYTPPTPDSNTFQASCLAAMAVGDWMSVTVVRVSGAGTFTTVLDGALTGFEGELIQ